MSALTSIEWADHTFNPWEGCQHVGPGCEHCFAEARNARFGGGVAPNWGPGAPRRRTSAANWRKPLQWNADAARFAEANGGRRQRVFCASLADVFDNAVDPQWRHDLFDLIDRTPNLDWLLLTKRIGNVAPMLGFMHRAALPPHVWLGATVVNQTEANRDIPKLMMVPAAVRFLSCEPLLGLINLEEAWHGDHALSSDCWGDCGWCVGGAAFPPLWNCQKGLQTQQEWRKGRSGVDWVIVGGESGAGARPMDPFWVQLLRDECATAGVPFLFKQWGNHLPGSMDGEDERGAPAWIVDEEHCGVDYDSLGRGTEVVADGTSFIRFSHARTGRLLDGVQHDGFPS